MNIAITGSGIISAIGLDKQSVLHSLREKRTGIGAMRYLQSAHTELPVGEVPLSNDEMKAMLHIPQEQEMSRTALMGMLAIGQALGEAKLPISQTPHETGLPTTGAPLRITLISGTTVGGMDITELHFDRLTAGADAESLRYHDCGSQTQLMADHFGVFTEISTISTACSSAANAMVLGANLLKSHQADIVVAGGTEALSRFHLNGFNSLMILDKERCRPFDATRAGLNLGEGAAFVVMESEARAKERGAGIQAYLTGYGNRCDAFHQTASSENGEGATLAMHDALEMAHLRPSDIHYVNAHGTGTPDNDRSESKALQRIFGEEMPPVSSTKGFTGHTTSASGSIETVICLLALQEQFIPTNLNWQTAMPDGILPTMGEMHATLTNVLCNSFGFGGNDTALVLSMHPTSQNQIATDKGEACQQISLKQTAAARISSVDELADIRQYVKPLEARRMGKLMKAALITSLKALKEAGIETPDAIITGTAYGCLENSEQLLEQLRTGGEEMLKPTLFMQSTHNTISSAIAIKTRCHGYNMTYTQGNESWDWAMRDAKLLLNNGQCRSVLVGCHDETTPLFREAIEKLTGEKLPEISSRAVVLMAE